MKAINASHGKGHCVLLEKAGLLLNLGKAIYEYHLFLNPDTYEKNCLEEATTDMLWERIYNQSTYLQEIIPTDKYFRPLKVALNFGTRPPAIERIQALALVAFRDQTLTYCKESIDSIAIKLSELFSSGGKIEGILYARQIVGRLLQTRVLRLNGENVTVCGEIRHWLAGMNRYAAFGLSEGEVDQLRVKAERPLIKAKADLRKRVEGIPILKPQELFDEIGRLGFVSQDHARRAISLAAYRHIIRLRRIHVQGINAALIPQRENCLAMGPTGSGKSFLVKTLFQNILKLPTALVDATGITETGYVGEDANIILVKLYHAAEKNAAWAECGIACIDEFDKLAANGSNQAVFGGQGSRIDVSRGGVQRSLLKILEENSQVDIPADPGPINRAQRITFNTSNVLFIASGAFTGIEEGYQKSIGFGGFGDCGDESRGYQDTNHTDTLCRFGISKELVGRFGSFIQFANLSVDDLLSILERNTIRRYAHELLLSGIKLVVEPEVKRMIVKQALENGTGARGLASVMAAALNDCCFSAYSADGGIKRVKLYLEGDSIRWEIEKPRSALKTTVKIENAAQSMLLDGAEKVA